MSPNNKKQTIRNKKKIAFVASGGAIKAACFHIGVMLAMERFGFSFLGGLKKDHSGEFVPGQVDTYVGSSAGAFLISLIGAGFRPEELYNSLSENFNLKTSPLRAVRYSDVTGNNLWSNLYTAFNSILNIKKTRHLSIEGVLQTILSFNGLFNTKNVGAFLKKTMPSDNFQDLAAELYMVTTELDNPNRIVLGPRELEGDAQCEFATDVPISEAAIGSMSLPFVFGPHKINVKGKEVYVFDGEVRKTMSTHIAKDAGADLVIASYTHQPYHYSPEYGSLMKHGLQPILIQAIYQLVESRIKTAKTIHDVKDDVFDEILSFFKEHDLSQKLLDELLERMAKRINFNPNLDYIHICPEPTDPRMFFEDHFNLSIKSMGRIIRSGFKSAYHTLKHYNFDFYHHETSHEMKSHLRDSLLQHN